MENIDGLRKRVNFLTAYAVVSSMVFAVVLLSSFANKDKNLTLDELTLKKMNLIGEDGKLRMVIANETRQHPGIISGKKLPDRERPAGIIFFNNQGDECGGIIASVDAEKGVTNSGMSFTMDNYLNDQVVQILNDETYENGKGQIQRGLIINEFPMGSNLMDTFTKHQELEKIEDQKVREEKIKELWGKEGSKRRLFVGRNKDNNSGLFLYDSAGKLKLKIYVDQDGNAKLEVVDNDGKTKSLLDEK